MKICLGLTWRYLTPNLAAGPFIFLSHRSNQKMNAVELMTTQQHQVHTGMYIPVRLDRPS